MNRGVATALVALAAFDYFYLDGKYLNYVQAVVTHYGQQVHFDGAKDEDTVLLIVGEGPATATPAEVR
jgi:hypothetical protein